jgi:site-specific recombinase XerD
MSSESDMAESDTAGNLTPLLEDFKRHLRAGKRSPGTVDLYARHVRYFVTWLAETRRPGNAAEITKAIFEDYFVELGERKTHRNGKEGATVKPTYVATQYRSLQQFWAWLVVEEEIDRDPFDKMGPPHAPDPEIPVMPNNAVAALLGTCKTRTFVDLRDTAILRLFLDTGLRVSGLAYPDLGDFNFERDTVHTVLKGGAEITLPFGAKTSDALRRYRRKRATHPQAARSDGFWLGDKGKLLPGGVRQMLERRAKDAKLGDLATNPHAFRHLFCHNWLLNGGNEHDLAKLMGWTSTKMAGRYAASAALERATIAHRRSSPGDKY